MKKYFILLALVFLAACAKEEDVRLTDGRYTLTLNASKAPVSKALNLSDNTLNASWTQDDIVVVYKGDDKIGELTAQSTGTSTTLKGTLDEAPSINDVLTLKFLSPSYSTQNGTLEYIESNCDYAEATVTVKSIAGGNVTIKESSANFVNQQAIVKFTLKDSATGNPSINATQLTITAGATTITVIPSSATDEFFVALPGISGQAVSLSADITPCYVYAYENASATFANSQYYEIGVMMTKQYVDLSRVTSNFTAVDSDELRGTLANNVKISIADGATVTLNGVNINGSGTWTSGDYAGINCSGNATINLADGTTNSVKGFNVDYPGIYVPSGKTLTIQETGSLNASSNGYGAGIGGGYKGDNTINCGNIIISGGTVTATGGKYAAGIGSGGNGCSCGTITINGGTVTAAGGQYAAGIGSGFNESSCGAITIQNTVTRVTATKGDSAPNSIGAGDYGSCGTVTIGGVVYYNGSSYQNDGETYLVTSPLIYPTPPPTGALSGKFTINAGGTQVYFSQGNLQATYNGSSWNWAFAANQWDYIGYAEGNTKVSGSTPFVSGYSGTSTTVDLFGWVGSSSNFTGAAQYGISNSTTTNNANGYGKNASEALKSDWGNTIGSGWRTLSIAEWQYLFNTRTSGSTVNGTSNARYSHATINTDGTGVNGMILFPDGVTIADSEATSWGTINDVSAWGTQCTTAQWAALASKGCVFLPAAGYRNGTSVFFAGSYGFYRSSSPNTSYVDRACSVIFGSSNLNPSNSSNSRCNGYSVRLVRDAN